MGKEKVVRVSLSFWRREGEGEKKGEREEKEKKAGRVNALKAGSPRMTQPLSTITPAKRATRVPIWNSVGAEKATKDNARCKKMIGGGMLMNRS